MSDKALLIGINEYENVSNLRGCHADVDDMKHTLVKIFDFKDDEETIRVRKDDDAIRSQLLSDFDWLLQGAKPGDRRVLHFSGHGSQIADKDRETDESDGKDELICLHDMDWESPDSYFLDDELADFLKKFPAGVELLVVFDSCHSGTGTRALPQPGGRRGLSRERISKIPLILDRNVQGTRGVDRSEPAYARYVPPPAQLAPSPRSADSVTMRSVREAVKVQSLNHVLLAAAKSEETAADAKIEGRFHGAFTYYLTKTLQAQGDSADRGALLAAVEQQLKPYGQTPQLEAARLTGPLFAGSDRVPSVSDLVDTMPSLSRPGPGIVDREVFLKLLDTYNRLLDIAVGGTGTREAVGGSRAPLPKQLVTVHGIGKHPAGYSNRWWEALGPHAPSLQPGTLLNDANPSGNRREVLWSDIVNRDVRDPETNAKIKILSAEIAASLHDRIGQARGVPTSRDLLENRDRGLGGFFSSLDDFAAYMVHRPTRDKILNRFFNVVRPLLAAGAIVELISHSWGTVVAYEGLVLLERENPSWPGRVHNFFTVGSALSVWPVQQSLLPESSDGHKPRMVGRWTNIDAKHDIVGGQLSPRFHVDQEFLDREPTNCGLFDVACSHGSYFVKENTAVNKGIFGRFIEEAS